MNENQSTAIVKAHVNEVKQEYGKSPLLVGLVTDDPFILNAAYSVGGLLLLASGLWTFVLALVYFWQNDHSALVGETRAKTEEPGLEGGAIRVKLSRGSASIDATATEMEDSNPFPAFTGSTPEANATHSLPKQPQEPTIASPYVSSTLPAPPKALTAFEVLIANPFLSRACFGAQRSGKSYLLAAASRELATTKDIKVFHINLASYGDEDAGYWQHCVRSVRCDLPSLDSDQAEYFIDQAIEVIHEFFSTKNAILIFDEVVLTGSLSNQHGEAVAPLLKLAADKMACLASTGVKRSQAIWTASPDFVAGALSQDCKALKSLSLCFVAIAPGKSVDWNGNPIKFHQESFENVARNFKALTYPGGQWKSERICFVDGKWREVGDLPPTPKAPRYHEDVKPQGDVVAQLERSYKAEAFPAEVIPQNRDNGKSKKDLMLEKIADWNNGYECDEDIYIELLDELEQKYGKEAFAPSQVHRSQTALRKLYEGKAENLKALCHRAVKDEMAIVEITKEGRTLVALL